MSEETSLARYKKLGQEFSPEDVLIRTVLRINTLKISEAECVSRLRKRGVKLTAIPEVPFAYVYEASFPLVSSEEYLLGFFYLQELASQIAPIVLLEDGKLYSTVDCIIDACAAPGSKTTQLAQLTNDVIPIYALDTTLLRLKKLEFNLERLGITSVQLFRKDALYMRDIVDESSHILLDAPCSGNFCIEQNYFNKRSPRDFKDRARLQRQLLQSAWAVLKPGGTLVYSTCSLEPEEDELVVQWALDTLPDCALTPISFPLGISGATTVFDKELDPSLALTKKFWPHLSGTQGFFIAKFKKPLE